MPRRSGSAPTRSSTEHGSEVGVAGPQLPLGTRRESAVKEVDDDLGPLTPVYGGA